MARNRRLDSGLSGKLARSVCIYNAEWHKKMESQKER
jgi:hypothetical protein